MVQQAVGSHPCFDQVATGKLSLSTPAVNGYSFKLGKDGWMDDLAILGPFQQYFSLIRTLGL